MVGSTRGVRRVHDFFMSLRPGLNGLGGYIKLPRTFQGSFTPWFVTKEIGSTFRLSCGRLELGEFRSV